MGKVNVIRNVPKLQSQDFEYENSLLDKSAELGQRSPFEKDRADL